MRRRALLASVGASLGALAGCPGRTTPERRRSVTPAPVPTDDERATVATAASTPVSVFQFPSSLGCPLLPGDADVYVCSPRAYSGGLELYPDQNPFVLGPARRADDALSFTLTNRSTTAFETRIGRWLLARNDPGGWNVLAKGRRDRRLAVGADEVVTWTLALGSDGEASPGPTVTADGEAGERTEAANATDDGTANETPAERSVRRTVSIDAVEGIYSFGVHGFHEGGRLVALQAPFVIDVRGAERSR
ncbi:MULTISPECIES: hypothetical protein [Haloarcula]|uniref:hypothetical protein n=1 Tax=Haloarcula TaxID=2237 RepID=UPI0023EBDEE2|nr:hypothetical protein [Halomicroarcula sp. XH51]